MLAETRTILTKHKLMAILFLFSTSFYLYQHSTGFSWDFASYALNARYLGGAGYYFEWFRPPLVPFTLFLFSFAGWLAAEYVYIVFASALYLYSSIRLADSLKIDRTSFYAFSLTAYTMMAAFSVGTEMFSLALTQLFLAHIKMPKAGAFLGLATLARYPNIVYFPLLLFQRDAKRILLSATLFFAVLLPWFLFNYASTGDALTGVADAYAINFLFRRGVYENAFSITDILVPLNIVLPLFLFGLVKKVKKINEQDAMLLVFFALTTFSFVNFPLKHARFLLPLVIPAAYFASTAVAGMRAKGEILMAYAAASVLLLAFFLPSALLESTGLYTKLAAQDCATQSNIWVPLNYYGGVAEPFPYMEELNVSVQGGYRIVLLKYVRDPAYAANETFLHGFPVIEENDAYIILGDAAACRKPERYDKTFLHRQNEYYAKYKRPLNLTPIKALLAYSLPENAAKA